MKSNEVIDLARMAADVDPFGCAHIVVEDNNLYDESIDFCLEQCSKPVTDLGWAGYDEDNAGRAFAFLWLQRMRALSEDDRETVMELYER